MRRQNADLSVVEMAPSDINVVLQMENECFYHAPWTQASSFLNGRQGYSFVVRNATNNVVGYLVLKVQKSKALVELVKMATHPKYCRQGIGSFLVGWTQQFAASHGAKRVTLHVRESNCAARRLYINSGFIQVDRKSNYYRSGNTTADRMGVEMEITLDAG